jgi:hypothetical protein
MSAMTKKELREADNLKVMKLFRDITEIAMAEANSRKNGVTKATTKAEAMIIEELCKRLSIEYAPEDWAE